ncbi:MAG: AMP-binding protein [Candidatus Helarchaeota archaeon]|nr:AMP-binding protein [Candidatus Helarchaeota archaeon]
MKESVYDEKIWLKSHDKHVKRSFDYSKKPLGQIFDEAMQKFPDKPACWMMKREIPYKELRDYVHRFATFLQQNGLKKGDRVTICLPSCPQYMIAHFGTLLAGGVASGCSFLLSADEIAYQINDSEAKFLVTLDAIYQKILKKEGVLDEVPKLETIIATNVSEYMGLSKIIVFIGKLIGKIPKGKVKPHPGKKVVQFKDVMLTEPDLKEVSIDVNNDLALLQYTGGTTGRPKGTELTHMNLISNITQISNWADFVSGEDVFQSAFPFFHLAGLAFCQICVWNSNSQILIVNPRDTDHFIKEWIDRKPTLILNVPTLYLMLMNNPKHENIPKATLDNVKIYVSGAAPFPAESIKEFEEEFNAEKKVLEVYGMTETSPLITMNPRYGGSKIGTVGMPIQDTEIRLVDIDTGEPVELGQPGEIICKGPQVSRGYYKKPEANAKTIIDGWFHTGDVGVMDEDGFIKIVDRTKDMLIVSGFKVYSVHVEDVLVKHPDIEIAALIGLKDPNRPGSEIVKAYIMLKKGVKAKEELQEDIKRYAAENLSKYENPKQWEFRDELPLTLVGKVLKKELREEINQ